MNIEIYVRDDESRPIEVDSWRDDAAGGYVDRWGNKI